MTTTANVENSSCSRQACFAPDLACVLGKDECENFSIPTSVEAAVEDEVGQVLPWSGASLGLSDLFPVAALGRPRVIGVVGAANSGKTTLLAGQWIAARRGIGSFGTSFAGSYTISGWHQIARHLQWIPNGAGFPPHTSAVDERAPALLHMSIALNEVSRHQVLFADAPGEWFTRWSEVPAEAPGAEWVAAFSDAFVILADADALSGSLRGKARGAYVALAHRLASSSGGRPVVPVLTKADIPVPDAILDQIDSLNLELFGAPSMKVSARSTGFHPITAAIDAAMSAALDPKYRSQSEADRWAEQMVPTRRRAQS